MARKQTGRRGRPRGIDFSAELAKSLADPEFRHHFEQRRIIQEIAVAVRGMRESAGLTQDQLARAIGSTQPSIARLEKGLDQRTPRWDTLRRIAVALNKQLKLVFTEPSDSAALVEVKGSARGGRRAEPRATTSPTPTE